MIGRRELTELLVNDTLVRFDRAVLWMSSDRRWRLEVDNVDATHLGGINAHRQVAFRTAEGLELRGEVRTGPRRLFPFNRTTVLEGVEPLDVSTVHAFI